MNDHPDNNDEIRPLSVRLRRRGIPVPFWAFRPVCWIIRHQWWQLPKGLPYPIQKVKGDSLVITLFPEVKVCIRCHKPHLTVPESKPEETTGDNTCEMCDEQVSCVNLQKYGYTMCCTCDGDLARNEYCSDCFSGLVSDATDAHKDKMLEGMK